MIKGNMNKTCSVLCRVGGVRGMGDRQLAIHCADGDFGRKVTHYFSSVHINDLPRMDNEI